MLQGLNRTQPSFIQGKSPLNAPIVPLPLHRGATSKSTCQHIQGRGISVVTSARIHASKLMISRNTHCSILERIPLPAISAASLAGGQADWNITCFPTLVRNLLLARNAKNHAGSPMICKQLRKCLRRLYEAPFLAPFFLAPHSSNPGRPCPGVA